MTQKNLNQWLNIKDLNIPKYFYWKWGEDAIWTNEKKKGNFEVEIFWKEYNHKLILVGNYPENTVYNLNNIEDPNIPLMKSHLQKCVRKKLYTKAVKTAYQLINSNFNEFIRRINIIMLEDTILVDSYVNLIWMMLAFSSKKWFPQRIHIEWLLGIVHNLCDIELYDEYETHNVPKQRLYISDLNINQQSIIYSMQIRISYGGMKGDMSMIQYLINKNIKKFRNGEEIIKKKVRRVSLIMEFLPYKKFDFSAVDFHCYPYFTKNIKNKFPEYFEDEIEKIVWKFRSGINVRKKQIKSSDDWNKIKNYVTWLSEIILKNLE